MTQTQKELKRFIVSGICAVATDMLFYYALSNFIDISVAKGTSFIIGTVVAYLMNKYYTFEQKEKNILEAFKFFVLYTVSLCANICMNKLCFIVLPIMFCHISFLDNYQAIKLFAFLCATGISTIINFMGQRFWVFKK